MAKPHVKNFQKLVELWRTEIDENIAVQQIVVFCEIAAGREGITMPELQKKLGMSQGAISRNVKQLSEWIDYRGKRKGYGLLRAEPDLMERRRLAVFLTAAGKKFAEQIEHLARNRFTDQIAKEAREHDSN